MSEGSSRYAAVIALTVAAFALLWGRLFQLQVVHHDYYNRVAEENRIQMVRDVARRGLIRDRHELILAQNDPSYSVYVNRSKAKPLDSAVNQLARILELDPEDIMQRIRTSGLPHFEPVRVARHIALETVCRIEEQSELLPGIFLRYESTRSYPDPAGGSHLLGYLTEVTPDSVQMRTTEGSFVGVRGVESVHDGALRGTDGVLFVEVTAAGQMVGLSRDHRSIPSIPGADVVLTVDWNLQHFAAEALAQRGTGSVVCLDPRSGDVLALVNVPAFDPNMFSGVLPQDQWEQVVNDPSHPLLDRALRGVYPPGSTTKMVTAAAGLEEGLVAPTTTFSPCLGGMQFGNRYFRCWKAAGHGTLNLVDAIEQSCDVYFYQLALRLGVETWARYARRFGLGQPTGIDLPDETGGLVPDSAWYNRNYGRRGWTVNMVLNLGIGQGELLATPLQVAQLYAAIANGGRTPTPHVFSSYLVDQAPVAHATHSDGLDPGLRRETVATLQHALRQVVSGEHGTARVVNFPDLAVSGKTGTAQNPHGENHSWFAAYAPSDAPEIVVVVLVENAGQGSEVAAPVCGEILRHWFDLPSLDSLPVPARPAPAVASTVVPDTVRANVPADAPQASVNPAAHEGP